ncbi:MAG: hypothetical protein PHO92_00835 [Candidatus Peribacteraceae bacterium]|nr:hypothetical protein [Candidatus Peribacteraceae bacterium]
MQDIRFKRIVIKSKSLASKEKVVYSWEDKGKPVNIFYYKNNAGKTTLYNIIYDVVDFKESKGDEIFTSDLFEKGIEAEIEFETANHKFIMVKNYIGNSTNISAKNLLTEEETILKTREEYSHFLEKLLEIPNNIYYLNTEKITLFNLLHLHFVNDKEYKGNVRGKYHYCTIANHTFDGVTTPLFYFYIFNAFKSNEELVKAYELGSTFRSLEKKMESFKELAKLTIDRKKIEKGQPEIFDSENEMKGLDEKKREIAQLRIETYNYSESLKMIQQINGKLSKALETNDNMTEQIKAWMYVLKYQGREIEKAISRIQHEVIPRLQREKKVLEEKVEGLESYEMEKIKERYELAKKTMKTDTGTTLDFLKDFDLTNSKFEKSREEFYEIIRKLQKTSILGQFNEKIKPFLPEGVSATLSLQEGKVEVNTSSDSVNRLVRFIALSAFILLKDDYQKLNHFNFLFADSPFIGVGDQMLQEMIYKLLAAIKANDTHGQYFIFLNKNDDNEHKKAFEDHSSVIQIDTGDGKIFNFD